jgi:hypothetical protein
MGYHSVRAGIALGLICGAGTVVSAEPKNKAKAPTPAVYSFGDIMKPVDFVPRPRVAVEAADPLSPEARGDITGSVDTAQAQPKK